MRSEMLGVLAILLATSTWGMPVITSTNSCTTTTARRTAGAHRRRCVPRPRWRRKYRASRAWEEPRAIAARRRDQRGR